MQIGKIEKVVRVARSTHPEATAGEPSGGGYGIITLETGEHIFFVDSAVIDGRFHELTKGQQVLFMLEDGPLLRARLVQPIEKSKERNRPTLESFL